MQKGNRGHYEQGGKSWKKEKYQKGVEKKEKGRCRRRKIGGRHQERGKGKPKNRKWEKGQKE